MSLELNVEKLVGVATGNPPSFRPSGTQKFYFINRPPMPNIVTPTVISQGVLESAKDISVIAVIKSPSMEPEAIVSPALVYTLWSSK